MSRTMKAGIIIPALLLLLMPGFALASAGANPLLWYCVTILAGTLASMAMFEMLTLKFLKTFGKKWMSNENDPDTIVERVIGFISKPEIIAIIGYVVMQAFYNYNGDRLISRSTCCIPSTIPRQRSLEH